MWQSKTKIAPITTSCDVINRSKYFLSLSTFKIYSKADNVSKSLTAVVFPIKGHTTYPKKYPL